MCDTVMNLFLGGQHKPLNLEPYVSPHVSAIRASRENARAEV